jgi:hypothetical protein
MCASSDTCVPVIYNTHLLVLIEECKKTTDSPQNLIPTTEQGGSGTRTGAVPGAGGFGGRQWRLCNACILPSLCSPRSLAVSLTVWAQWAGSVCTSGRSLSVRWTCLSDKASVLMLPISSTPYCTMRSGFSSRECGSDTLYGDIACHHCFLVLARVAMLIVDS